MAGMPRGSLALFKSVEWPTVLPVKLRYSDLRAVVASGNQGQYIYRLNSVFDPDETGVGGQPAGYDQLKTLYGRYRVMACKYNVSMTGMTSGGAGMLAVAPSDSALSTTAEAVADFRYAKSGEFQYSGFKAQVSGTLHIGELLGYSDESVLANSNLDAAVTGNPAFQQHLLINFETTGATDTVELDVTLEYFVRMEVPIVVQDSVARNRFAHLRLTSSLAPASDPAPIVEATRTTSSTTALHELQASVARCLALTK
jgi:hypothetical protein